MTKLDAWKMGGAVLLLCAATAIAARAQVFNTLMSFDGRDGGDPPEPLVQGINGSLYGTTPVGGAKPIKGLCGGAGCGTVFKISAVGALTRLYSFCTQANCTDGMEPYAGLVQATDGNLYGTTAAGGVNNINGGTVFKITSNGALTRLYSFCAQTNCTDGKSPQAPLVQGTDGNFYGTTVVGGANNNTICTAGNPGCGTVFKITSSGVLTTLYSFCAQPNCADGALPYTGLIQGTDGNFYGTTSGGGANSENTICLGDGCGTVFTITSGGALTTLYSFCAQTNCTDGAIPYAGLIQATNGNFYGTTGAGGSCIYRQTHLIHDKSGYRQLRPFRLVKIGQQSRCRILAGSPRSRTESRGKNIRAPSFRPLYQTEL